ncbi:MAG: hypothetical protein ACLR78_13860 [Roseburia sp.]
MRAVSIYTATSIRGRWGKNGHIDMPWNITPKDTSSQTCYSITSRWRT